MDCSQVKNLLFEHPDTEFPSEIRQSVEAHLAGCPSCTALLSALQAQGQALEALPKAKAPHDFLERVRERIEAPSRLERIQNRLSAVFGPRHLLEAAGAAAAAVLVVLLTYQVTTKESSKQAPTFLQRDSADSPGLESFEARRAKEEAQPAPPVQTFSAAPEQSAPPGETQEPPLALTLILKLPAASAQAEPLGTMQASAMKAPEPPAARSPLAPPRIENKEIERAQAPSSSATKSRRLSKDAAPVEEPAVLAELRRLVAQAGGEVLEVTHSDPQALPDLLRARIPSETTPEFLEDLRRLGTLEFEGNSTTLPSAKGGFLLLTLKFASTP